MIDLIKDNIGKIISGFFVVIAAIAAAILKKRSINKVEKNEVDNSINNNQIIGSQIINQGISYADVVKIIDSKFSEISMHSMGKGKGVFIERIDKATTRIMATVDQDSFKDPDFINSFRDVVFSIGLSGDEDLSDLLIDLLAERSKKQEGRSFENIVLREALAVVPKLTNAQLDILACSFSLYKIRFTQNTNLEAFINS